jgi:hypothetical protein
MQKHFLTLVFTFIAVLTFSSASAITATTAPQSTTISVNVTKADIEQKLDRKLTLKERLLLPFIKKSLKRDMAAANDGQKMDGMALTGFILGVLGVFYLGFLFGLLGIIFSAIGLNNIRKNPDSKKGRGLAIAGLVCGIVGFVGWTLYLIAAITTV